MQFCRCAARLVGARARLAFENVTTMDGDAIIFAVLVAAGTLGFFGLIDRGSLVSTMLVVGILGLGYRWSENAKATIESVFLVLFFAVVSVLFSGADAPEPIEKIRTVFWLVLIGGWIIYLVFSRWRDRRH